MRRRSTPRAAMVVFLPAHFVPGDGAEAGEDQKAHVQAGLEFPDNADGEEKPYDGKRKQARQQGKATVHAAFLADGLRRENVVNFGFRHGQPRPSFERPDFLRADAAHQGRFGGEIAGFCGVWMCLALRT